VVGADGIRSSVRKLLIGDSVTLRYLVLWYWEFVL
jgi:2-polyprenyl-6-methoxyphenol hydroxylase-like FAD-dependent oxidoreductase